MVTVIATLLTLDEVMARLKMSRSSIYRLMAEFSFPRPVRIGGRTNRWREDEVTAWLAEQPEGGVKGGVIMYRRGG